MSIAINTPIDDREHDGKPWYRYGWPWFLISIPFVSMALGGMMLYLGLSANNSLVVDDYYTEGKAINLRIERDRTAALLGLTATLTPTAEALVLEVSQSAPVLPVSLRDDAAAASSSFKWPEALQVRWVHVTQAERDGEAILQSVGGARYVAADVRLPGSGKYRVHVQPVDDAPWRLVSPLVSFEDADSLKIPALRPEEVFPQSVFE
jgi:hypothetical protein